MKNIILVTLFALIAIKVNAQFVILSGGHARLHTNSIGPWDNSFISYANHDYTKALIVERSGNHYFYVTGNGQTWSTGYMNYSDRRFKENISDIGNINNFYKLKPQKYDFIGNQNGADSIKSKGDKNNQYGFIAQDVRELFPEIVGEDENGYLAINYTQIIPLAVEAIKNQKTQIEELQALLLSQEQELNIIKEQIKSCCNFNEEKGNNKSATINTDINSTSSTIASLSQNAPNPFNESTVIGYYLPESTNKAILYIYNMNGLQIKAIPVQTKGIGSITINGSELQPGMYLYTLIADSKEIDTKRMILTE